MDSTLNPTQKTHIVWLDVVRLVAMFTVVCCHSADPFNFYPGEPPANIAEIKWWGAVYGSLLRPCVPLFVMITGAFIIRKSKFPQNPKRSVRFSGKRTKRSVQKRKARNTQKAETKVL